MEIARLVLEYLEALVWPGAIVLGVWIFRRPLADVLLRMNQAKLPGGVSFNFDTEIRNTKQLSQEVRSAILTSRAVPEETISPSQANSVALSLGLQPSPSGLDLSMYFDLAREDPSFALGGLRMEIEIFVHNLVKKRDIQIGENDSTGLVLRKLLKSGDISFAQYNLAQQVLQLCNQAIHGWRPTQEEAEIIIDAAQSLVDQYLIWLSEFIVRDTGPNPAQ